MKQQRYFVEDGRLKSVNPWSGEIVDVLKHSDGEPYTYFVSVSNKVGEDPPYFFDLPDFVIYESDTETYRKKDNDVVDRNEEIVGLGHPDLAVVYSFVSTKPGTGVLSDTLAGLGVDLDCTYTTEKIKLEKILAFRGYSPIMETDHGIYINQMFFDNSLKDIICSPILNKMEFKLFPVFALGETYSITTEEWRKLSHQRINGGIIRGLIELCREKDLKILVETWDADTLTNNLRELIYTGIEPKLDLLGTAFKIACSGYINFLIVDK